MKQLKQNSTIFSLGAIGYGIIELLWRRRTHWSMIITGGCCFLSLYKIFEKFSHIRMPQKCIIGSTVITAIEFIVGCIVNLKLKLNVWDYSSLRFNLFGQISLMYSVFWGALTIPISFLCSRLQKFQMKKNKISANVSID